MLDVDVVKLLPELHQELQQKFKLPEILPGGSHCMMSVVSILDILTSLVIPGNVLMFLLLTAFLLLLSKGQCERKAFHGPKYVSHPASVLHLFPSRWSRE